MYHIYVLLLHLAFCITFFGCHDALLNAILNLSLYCFASLCIQNVIEWSGRIYPGSFIKIFLIPQSIGTFLCSCKIPCAERIRANFPVCIRNTKRESTFSRSICVGPFSFFYVLHFTDLNPCESICDCRASAGRELF